MKITITTDDDGWFSVECRGSADLYPVAVGEAISRAITGVLWQYQRRVNGRAAGRLVIAPDGVADECCAEDHELGPDAPSEDGPPSASEPPAPSPVTEQAGGGLRC